MKKNGLNKLLALLLALVLVLSLAACGKKHRTTAPPIRTRALSPIPTTTPATTAMPLPRRTAWWLTAT